MATLPPAGSSSAKLGVAAILASVLIPVAQVVAPTVQQMFTSAQQRKAQALQNAVAHREQVAHIIIDSYLGRSAAEQRSALVILNGLFSEEMCRIAPGLAGLAADSTVTNSLDNALAAVKGVDAATLKEAKQAEEEGRRSLEEGDVGTAREHFTRAAEIYPEYHDVAMTKAHLDQVPTNDTAAARVAMRQILTNGRWMRSNMLIRPKQLQQLP